MEVSDKTFLNEIPAVVIDEIGLCEFMCFREQGFMFLKKNF